LASSLRRDHLSTEHTSTDSFEIKISDMGGTLGIGLV
jgi:hypothetical protein